MIQSAVARSASLSARRFAALAFMMVMLALAGGYAVADPQSSGIGSFNLQSVDPAEVNRLVKGMQADRLLLAEVRKDIPDSREEASIYLSRLKDLSAQSDPVRLVPLINRVLDQAPIFYDWLDKKFDNASDRVAEYYVGGARGFSFALDTFKNAVLLTVINRLDIASQILSQLTSDSGNSGNNGSSN